MFLIVQIIKHHKTKLLSVCLILLTGIIYPQIIERGFGYRSILYLHHAGPDYNNDGFGDLGHEKVFGEKAYPPSSSIFSKLYSVPKIPGELVYSYSSGDFDGDGMDDYLFTYADTARKETRISLHDGNDGRIFGERFELSAPMIVKTAGSGDLFPDGRSEFVLFTPGSTTENGKIFVLDYVKGLIEAPLPKYNLSDIITDCRISYSGSDPVLYCLFNKPISSDGRLYDLLEFDPVTLVFFPVAENISSSTHLEIGNIPADKNSPDIIALSGREKPGGAIQEIISISRGDGEIIKSGISAGSATELNSEIISGIISLGETPAYLFSVKDSTNKKKASIFSLDLFSGRLIKIRTFENAEQVIFSDDFFAAIIKSDNTAEIWQLNGQEIIKEKSFTGVLPEVFNNIDPVIEFQYSDLNNDGIRELIILADDTDQDTVKGNNSIVLIYDGETGKNIFRYSSRESDGEGAGCYGLILLDNNIGINEIFNAVDLEADPGLYEVKKLYERGQINMAFTALKAFFRFRPEPAFLDSTEYYFNANSGDILAANIMMYSTAAAMEASHTGEFGGSYNDPASAGLRLARLYRTFLYRLHRNSPQNYSEETFRLHIASMISHIRWSLHEKNHTAGTNHGALFEMNHLLYGAAVMNIFKDKNAVWEPIIHERLLNQTEHVLPDGVHDEFSLAYEFLIADEFNRILRFSTLNSDFISVPQNILSKLTKTIENSYRHLLYSVKPVYNRHGFAAGDHFADLPAIGDSRNSFVGRWLGKIYPVTDRASILFEPIKKGYTKFWNDNTLADNLLFAAQPLVNHKKSVPEKTSIVFPAARHFIFRNNWANRKYGTYDQNARYCYFKAGDIVPQPGKYEGYSTSSRHSHSDLLSLEIAAYNKNLVVDPGGYFSIANTTITENFDDQFFEQAYGFLSGFNEFDTPRYYFKGSGTHNTVFVNNRNQAEYINEYFWGGLDLINSNLLSYYISPDIDYAGSAYSLNSGQFYIHSREVYFPKPIENLQDDCDYWIIHDRIKFSAANPDNIAEQRWMISADQSQKQIIPGTSIFKGDNFYIIPLKTGNINPSSELIESYVSPNENLIRTQLLKISASGAEEINIISVILPFPESDPVPESSISLQLDPGSSPESVFAFNFNLAFDKGGNSYLDKISISSENQTEANINSMNNPQKISDNYMFMMDRFKNGNFFRSYNISLEDILRVETESNPETFNLYQNYPNPFNPVTHIKFSLEKTERVSLRIFNLLGQEVRELQNSELAPGSYKLFFDGNDNNGNRLPSGVYFYRLGTEDKSAVKKMLLLK